MHDIAVNIPQEREQQSSSMVLRKKSLRQTIKEIYLEFCSNTSIHGFQYFGQQRPRKEIFFWLAVFVVSIYCCASIVVKVYAKWDTTPVIVSFADKSTPIWNIPFPAVTICPVAKRAMKQTDPLYAVHFEYFKAYLQSGEIFNSNFTQTDLEEFLTLTHVCPQARFDYEMANFTHPSLDYIAILDRMLPGRPFLSMTWRGYFISHENIFTSKVYTTDGICHTFNALRALHIYREDTVQYQKDLNETCFANCSHKQYSYEPLNWSLDSGYAPESNVRTFPNRVLNSGIRGSLSMELVSAKDKFDYSCNGDERGFKVLLHSPDDVPVPTSHRVHISVDRKTVIAVKPKMITTSMEVAAYEPQKRQCYMASERYLRFFKFYTQNNCELECLTNFTLKECDCVAFAMPRTPEMTVCGYDKFVCYFNANYDLMDRQFSSGGKDTNRIDAPCNCMPACTSLEYDAETSDLIMYNKNYFREFDLSLLEIYFKENHFITSRRSELYGLTDLLANFGGVFGLFMGVSILSVIEMFYHCTLRLWTNMTRHRL